MAGVATVPSAFSVPSWTVSELGVMFSAIGIPEPKLMPGTPMRFAVTAIVPVTPVGEIVSAIVWPGVWVIETPSVPAPSVSERLDTSRTVVPVLSCLIDTSAVSDWPSTVTFAPLAMTANCGPASTVIAVAAR